MSDARGTWTRREALRLGGLAGLGALRPWPDRDERGAELREHRQRHRPSHYPCRVFWGQVKATPFKEIDEAEEAAYVLRSVPPCRASAS